jgi:hypothetical protein
VGLVIGEDEVPFMEGSRVDMFVIMGFGACFGSFDILESGATIFIGLFEGEQTLLKGGGIGEELNSDV